LYWVRHGENPANLTKEFSHRKVDYSLTPKGVLQAQQTAEHFAGQAIQAVYTSPLKRAVETAQIIAQRLGLEASVVENFREVNVGDLEGQPPTTELWARHDQIMRAWLSGEADLAFPNGEDLRSLRRRLWAGLDQITTGANGQRVIVVGHGGSFILLLPELCPRQDLQPLIETGIHNCAITEVHLSWRNGQLASKLVRWASTTHLHGAAADLAPGTPQAGELE
jgi:broad specificity phosphatase PhoE